MDMPLLTTKLTVPPLRRELVRRPRLIERLNEGLNEGLTRTHGFARKLTLVSAPAGYGKTTLVARWLDGQGERASPLPVAWISLDAADNDLARFFVYLLAALQQSDDSGRTNQIGRDVQSLLQAPQLPSIEWMLTTLINDLAAAALPLVLVLDDYHTITEPLIHQAVEFLLEQQPSMMHTVLISRQDPPFPLARWRVRGQVTDVRERDLGFTVEESVVFFNHTMGLHLSADDVDTLRDRTEGWVAGLQMAALALQASSAEEMASLVGGFSGRHHYVLDYLTDEVIKRQPAEIQTFLTHTCVLERMCGALCDELLAGCSSQGILEQLDRSHLFVVPLDGERKWYRYHRLFAELLRARLRDEGPDRIPVLHRRAATWYESAGLGTDAVYHALETGDAAFAVSVVERVVGRATTWSRLDGATYLGWLEALPRESVRARPRLLLLAARAFYVTGQRQSAERVLRDLELVLRQDAPVPGTDALLEQVAADRASYAAMRGEVCRAMAWARPALERAPEDDALARIRPAATLGLACFRAGDVVEAGRVFSLAISAAEGAGLSFAAVPLLCNLAEVQVVQGRLREALLTCDRAEQAGTVSGRPTQALGFVGLLRARVAYERNELEAAERQAREGLDRLRQSRITLGQETLCGLLAQILQARGDGRGASAAIEQALHIARGNDIPRLLVQTAAYQARVWLIAGHADDLERVAGWAEDYGRVGDTEYLREFEDLTLARVLLACRRPTEALAVLEPLLALAEAAGRVGRVIEALTLSALGQHALGNTEGAREALSRALQRAEPEGFVRVFVDAGEAMRELLGLALGPARAYARRLLAICAQEKPAPSRFAPVTRAMQPEPLVEPLTPRELEVLGLLAEGLSNPEIAQRLVVSLPTVKSHTRNLYGKLSVHSRKAAVARARMLGILDETR